MLINVFEEAFYELLKDTGILPEVVENGRVFYWNSTIVAALVEEKYYVSDAMIVGHANGQKIFPKLKASIH